MGADITMGPNTGVLGADTNYGHFVSELHLRLSQQNQLAYAHPVDQQHPYELQLNQQYRLQQLHNQCHSSKSTKSPYLVSTSGPNNTIDGPQPVTYC